MIGYDMTPRIGWGEFSLDDCHPFFRAACVHDARYDDLIAGISQMTLKQVDREFLGNCLRAAAAENWFRGTKGAIDYLTQAWGFYAIVRTWAKTFRRDLDSFKPKEN